MALVQPPLPFLRLSSCALISSPGLQKIQPGISEVPCRVFPLSALSAVAAVPMHSNNNSSDTGGEDTGLTLALECLGLAGSGV